MSTILKASLFNDFTYYYIWLKALPLANKTQNISFYAANIQFLLVIVLIDYFCPHFDGIAAVYSIIFDWAKVETAFKYIWKCDGFVEKVYKIVFGFSIIVKKWIELEKNCHSHMDNKRFYPISCQSYDFRWLI